MQVHDRLMQYGRGVSGQGTVVFSMRSGDSYRTSWVNCYHTYYPFFPGLSERNWSDEWLDAKNLEESEPKKFRDKEYTLYEAKQKATSDGIGDAVAKKKGSTAPERQG